MLYTSSQTAQNQAVLRTVASCLHFRVITHNVRFATSTPSRNERPWTERGPLILDQLKHELRLVPLWPSELSPWTAFICLQEVLHQQLTDLLAGLNNCDSSELTDPPEGPLWAHIGVGRNDGATKGEYSPILYPVQLLRLLHQETVWLSPTPDQPSKGWDAGHIRILTVGVFEHIVSGKRVMAANTHLDDTGSQSRLESVGIILRTLKRIPSEWSQGGELAIFLAGDFNSTPAQEAYLAVKDSGYLTDLHDEVELRHHYGDVSTFTGFDPAKEKDKGCRIDFIWLGPASNGSSSCLQNTPWNVYGYAVLPNSFEAGVYLSDHRAVVGDFTLQ